MKKTFISRTIWGLAIILLGLAFLLNSIGVIQFSGIVSIYWPVIIILIGIVSLINNLRNYVVPVFIILAGVLLQLNRLGYTELNLWEILWPLAIIAIGLSIMLNRSSSKPNMKKRVSNEDVTNVFVALSGVENKIMSNKYQGGQISSVLGGASIDLSKAKIDGVADLKLFACLGGIELRVPDNWKVNISGTPILGGWENKTNQHQIDTKSPVLNIDATCIMGGIEVKN